MPKAPKLRREMEGNRLTIRFKDLRVSEEDVLRFHPNVKSLLEELSSHGWKYGFEDVRGSAVAEVDLGRASFSYWYHPPRLEEMEKEGEYRLDISLGARPPAHLTVENVERFEISISTEHSWRAASVDPFTSKVTHLDNPFVGGFLLREEGPRKLSQARELYELAKWLFQVKKMEAVDEYVTRHYKELLDRFESDRYRFPLRLELTVENEDKVPTWDELLKGLSRYFRARGLLMEQEKKPDFFDRKKPIP